jgi:LuxR family transcriptional regulator, maltose regulon positive regulatory protein
MVASSPALLQTKLAIPAARPDRVLRPRLTQQLDAGLEHPLTLICAPAGFGKTSLITDWYEQTDRSDFPLAWLSLDEDDNEPTRFLTYLISALETVSDIDSDDLISLLQSAPPPPPKVILTTLLSRIEEFEHRFALVLDDHHRLTAPILREIFTFLLDHMPSQMRLVITSREDPPLPLSRLRGRGQLAEIRASDLRFTPEEAAQFLNQMLGVELSAHQILDLDTRTEGWIAGLQLAALAMKGRSDIAGFISAFTGSHRYILDYLTDEVLSRQPEALQSFLLQTSILNRLSGSLCDAVTGSNDGQAMLEQIEHSNLFLISLDDERYWYRYHHLFGDMLRRHLQQSSRDNVLELHRRASEWFELNGWLGEAIEHALHGRDDRRAGDLVEHYSEQFWQRGDIATLLRWIKALPQAVLDARPKLGLNFALILCMTEAHGEVEQLLAKMEHILQPERFDSAEYSLLFGRTAAVRSTLLMLVDDRDGAIDVGQQALAHLPHSDEQWRAWVMMVMGIAYYDSKGEVTEGERYLTEAIRLSNKVNNHYTRAVALSVLAKLYMLQGHLQQSETACNQLLQHTEHHVWVGQAHLNRSRVRYEYNDIVGAFEDVMEAQRMIHDPFGKRVVLEGYVLLSHHKQIQGDESGALDLMRRAVDQMRADNLRDYFNSVYSRQAHLWLMQGNLTAAGHWAQGIETTAKNDFSYDHELEHITLARIQMAQGRIDEAQELLSQLLSVAQAARRLGRATPISILQALAARLKGNMKQALSHLEYALSIAAPEGYMRSFVDEGPPMAELLQEAYRRGIAPDYVAKLIAAFNIEMPTVTVPNSQSHDWIGQSNEPLSERELDVLRLLIDGASNREIAEQLFVSLGTVKKHISNIFIKLDAHSRTQVIAIARQNNLV